jgi:hypothetical protein
MQPEYLALIGQSVQSFVREVEEAANVDIQVICVDKPTDTLEVVIAAPTCELRIPKNRRYFPDGAVRHEVLHVKRFLVDRVPMLVLADKEEPDDQLDAALHDLDNAIEHVLIVPEEIHFHPERRQCWEHNMRIECARLYGFSADDRAYALCMHWTFLRHVLPGSPAIEVAREFAVKHALLELAIRFEEEFLSLATSKEELVRLVLCRFPHIPKNRAAFRYVNSITRSAYATPIE